MKKILFIITLLGAISCSQDEPTCTTCTTFQTLRGIEIHRSTTDYCGLDYKQIDAFEDNGNYAVDLDTAVLHYTTWCTR